MYSEIFRTQVSGSQNTLGFHPADHFFLGPGSVAASFFCRSKLLSPKARGSRCSGVERGEEAAAGDMYFVANFRKKNYRDLVFLSGVQHCQRLLEYSKIIARVIQGNEEPSALAGSTCPCFAAGMPVYSFHNTQLEMHLRVGPDSGLSTCEGK